MLFKGCQPLWHANITLLILHLHMKMLQPGLERTAFLTIAALHRSLNHVTIFYVFYSNLAQKPQTGEAC